MKGIHDNDVERSLKLLQGSASGFDETLGSIVIEMLRERQNISRQNICVKLATRIDTATDPLFEAHYCELLALMLGMKK